MLQKMPSFFFRELQLITVLLLILNPYKTWSTRFISLKLCVGFSIFDSVSFWLEFEFLFNKKHGLLTLKCHNSFQNKNDIKATHTFVPRPLTFKLQQVVWKINICVSLSFPKTDLKTTFLNLENLSFENITFSQ